MDSLSLHVLYHGQSKRSPTEKWVVKRPVDRGERYLVVLSLCPDRGRLWCGELWNPAGYAMGFLYYFYKTFLRLPHFA